MPKHISYTWSENVERLRALADQASDPHKARLLNLASLVNRNADFIDGSKKAITESRRLLSEADKLLLKR